MKTKRDPNNLCWCGLDRKSDGSCLAGHPFTKTRVVNILKEPCDIYCGRRKDSDFHFGNPYSHLDATLAVVKVKTRGDAKDFFRAWLLGKRDTDLDPRRREWILHNLYTLRGKRLGCYCQPKGCHAQILAEFAEFPPLELQHDHTRDDVKQ